MKKEENYNILELMFRLEWEICMNNNRLPTFEETRMLIDAMEIIISTSIKISKEV